MREFLIEVGRYSVGLPFIQRRPDRTLLRSKAPAARAQFQVLLKRDRRVPIESPCGVFDDKLFGDAVALEMALMSGKRDLTELGRHLALIKEKSINPGHKT